MTTMNVIQSHYEVAFAIAAISISICSFLIIVYSVCMYETYDIFIVLLINLYFCSYKAAQKYLLCVMVEVDSSNYFKISELKGEVSSDCLY